jgi:pre-mRNA-splicing factor SYF1
LWYAYLQERRRSLDGLPIVHIEYERLNNIFDRALAYMHKMPRIWLDYLNFLMLQRKVTKTRLAFDRALRALPITQHDRIWPLYIKFARGCDVPETAIRIFRRYLKLEPGHVEDYIDYLVDAGQAGEAARLLAQVLNDDNFVSKQGRSRHDMWMLLCDIASKNPDKVHQLPVEAIIRSGLKKFSNEVGRLWTALADYFIRLGNFEKARDIYQEGIMTVTTVRDFSQIWDAYTEFEYGLIAATMEEMAKAEEEGNAKRISQRERDAFELRMARYEDLIERQQILISDVLLRQNPHNVKEWHKRLTLFEQLNQPKTLVNEFTASLKTVDPMKAIGKPHTLWVRFAKFWETNGQRESARKVFEKAVNEKLKRPDHLAALWCDYIEFEIRQSQLDRARTLAQRATAVPPNWKLLVKEFKAGGDQRSQLSVQQLLFKQVRVWTVYADLEESLGTFETTRAVYEKILELRIATPAIILNYASYLEDHHHFEEAFKVYEKGVDIFKFPYCLDIWLIYLSKFVQRYGGTKLERTRDLFEQACEASPKEYARLFFVMYAEFEEKHGLARHVMGILDRATRAVPEAEKPGMFNIYLSKATSSFGVTRTREIFDKAVEQLPEKYAKDFCLRYAALERRLGEIDRARAIYTFASQLCDPKVETVFWQTWREFEYAHGSKDTFREMLRIKRSVAAKFSSGVNIIAANEMLVHAKKTQEMEARNAMKMLEDDGAENPESVQDISMGGQQDAAPALPAFTRSAINFQKSASTLEPDNTPVQPSKNDEEINLDDDEEDDEEGEEAEKVKIQQKAVPSAVFGGYAAAAEAEESGNGAKDRLKKRKRD